MALADRFGSHTRRNRRTGCLEWTGSIDKDGYGFISEGGRARRAHRVGYELAVGPIPKGKWVLHRCDNPSCVEPSHLFLGDSRTNVADKVAKDRQARGVTNSRARLTEDDVRDIRRAYARGERQVDLAKRFAIHQTHVSLIVIRKEWAHI